MGPGNQMRCSFSILALVSFIATPATAFELRFSMAASSDELKDAVSSASLLVPIANRADVLAQDVLAAAQADYGRIIGALYAAGYYAPVINIGMDGREGREAGRKGGTGGWDQVGRRTGGRA